VAVALDDSLDVIRPWVEAADPPLTSVRVALDADHRLAEAYGITNVPATVWIDEDDKVVKPPTITPGNNMFQEFTKIDAEGHHAALRRWVHEGVLPELPDRGDGTDANVARPPTAEEQTGRTERRLASWLHRNGQTEAAERHYARAVQLAPLDWTISRGSMPARGQDPFGNDFFDLYQEWEDAGRPDYQAVPGGDVPPSPDA